MITRSARRKMLLCMSAVLATWGAATADAANYAGTVGMLEVWKNGNIAFTLNGVSGTCGVGNQMVVNKSTDGTKNMYAALLAAKLAGRPISVNSPACGPAENYNANLYNLVEYLYVLD